MIILSAKLIAKMVVNDNDLILTLQYQELSKETDTLSQLVQSLSSDVSITSTDPHHTDTLNQNNTAKPI